MTKLTEAEQHEITAQHLRGNMAIEVWLIPFAVTVSLVLIFILVIVVLHFLKQK